MEYDSSLLIPIHTSYVGHSTEKWMDLLFRVLPELLMQLGSFVI